MKRVQKHELKAAKLTDDLAAGDLLSVIQTAIKNLNDVILSGDH